MWGTEAHALLDDQERQELVDSAAEVLQWEEKVAEAEAGADDEEGWQDEPAVVAEPAPKKRRGVPTPPATAPPAVQALVTAVTEGVRVLPFLFFLVVFFWGGGIAKHLNGAFQNI